MAEADLVKLLSSAFGQRKPAGPKARKSKTPRDVLLEWLAQIRPKDAPSSFSWEDYLQDFHTDPDNAPEWAVRHKLMFALNLHSGREKYLIVIKQAQDSDNIPIYIISVSVPRSEEEMQARQKIRDTYAPVSDNVSQAPVDPLRTIWVESFDMNSLVEILNRAALAILRWELRASTMKRPSGAITPPGAAKDQPGSDISSADGERPMGQLSAHAQAALAASLPARFPERDEPSSEESDDARDKPDLPE
ncbi:hypothetical protein GF420_13035 [candidate division GN15 bacterium]|nr:hypothetical protein [candidate division GN15 bacterium]